MKLDLHIHTLERSPCAQASEDEQIQAAIAAGLDAIFITDHWKMVSPGRLAELNRHYAPLRIFGGIELTVEGEDLLVLGIPDLLLEAAEWDYEALHAFVRQNQGFLVLAHPFRYHNKINLPLEALPPDAIEVHSHNTPPAVEPVLREISRRLSIPLLSDSDAHVTRQVGKYYNILPGDPQDMQDIFRLLRAGNHALYHP